MKRPAALLLLSAILVLPASAAQRPLRLDEMDLTHSETGWGHVEKNRSVSKKPIRIGGKRFERGVGVHAEGRMVFQLDGGAASFTALVGADDGPEEPGSVAFLVIADGETLFDSGTMWKGDAAREIDVDLAGRKIVELLVTDAGDGKNSDHANWADAVFTVSGADPRSIPLWARQVPHYEGAADVPASAMPLRAVTSPDGAVEASLYSHDGRLFLRVLRKGTVALDFSPLGITIDGVDLGRDARPGEAHSYAMNESFPWLGGRKTISDHFNGERIAMTTGSREWTLDLRAYDDGAVWRYVAPGSGVRTVHGEATSFVLPEGASYWTQSNTDNYEGNIREFPADNPDVLGAVSMPVTVVLPGGGFACYTEADTMHYSGMTFGPQGRILTGIFEDDPDGWPMQGDIASPWRVVIAVDDLTALVNSGIVPAVCPPPNPKFFPKGALTSWIKPGRTFWTWGFGAFETARWDRIMGYVDDAAALNCQYFTIDDPWRKKEMGWHRNGGNEWDSLREVTAYAAKKKVGIMVWEHWARLRDPDVRREFFADVARAGAVGVKIDFMDSESHERLAFYRSCLELGAEFKVLVNFHGANKPAGESRTWPNEVTREGIRGTEQGNHGLAPQHWAALPFTRLVTGAGDFTPTTLDPARLHRTTPALQLASAVVYTSPVEHWGDSADVYLEQPAEVVEFIRTKPTVWDETIVLPGSEIGKIAAFARRSGSQWWIGVLNGTDEAQPYSFKLDFLGDGGGTAVLFEDGASGLEISRRDANSGETVSTTLAPGGGFVMIAGE